MKVIDLLEQRRENWRQLARACDQFESHRRVTPDEIGRFGQLYRAACADLALADAYQLPPNTVQYLHQLVARAHNLLYRGQGFQWRRWTQELFVNVPQRLFNDPALRLAFVLFWGLFIACMVGSYNSSEFAERTLGKSMMLSMEEMYEKPLHGRDANTNTAMAGFYVQHNASIGIRCFSMGLIFGLGGLLELISNAVILGSAFGHMATVEQRVNFFQFVTAHGPFELTAVVLAAAAGMRFGFSLVMTHGYTRVESLLRAAPAALSSVILAVILFCLAAVIEGFISPSGLPYSAKVGVAFVSAALLLFYFVILGYPRSPLSHATRSDPHRDS